MLRNPFTPTEIASSPADFFGRAEELDTVERSLMQGSVVIQGPMGIGKSSLLAQGVLRMEGFSSEQNAETVSVVADKEIDTTEKAALLLLSELVEVDESNRSFRLKIGNFFEGESGEIVRNFAEGRHLANLKRLVEKQQLEHLLNGKKYLILAIDEADKAPVPLARLIRAMETHTQQHGIKGIRFLIAGVSPFYQKMIDEDQGLARFFSRTILLSTLSIDDSFDLVESKMVSAIKWAKEDGFDLRVDPRVIKRVVALSGGHPHILQLLGSHLIDHENEDADGVIDERDLAKSLKRICYVDRAGVYESVLHYLSLNFKIETLRNLLAVAPLGFPTRMNKKAVASLFQDGLIQADDIHWLKEHNVLSLFPDGSYGLEDEFLRVRMLMDAEATSEEQAELEQALIEETSDEVDDENGDTDYASLE